MNAYNQYPRRPAALKHFILKAIGRNSRKSGNPELFETWGIFQFGGFILRDASRSLSSGAHSRDPLVMLLRACPKMHPAFSDCF
jgi:hypothetical protein